MKTLDFLKWTMVCALGVFVTASCSDDDDDDRVDVPSQVQAAFDQKYAGAGRVEWDMEHGGYFVAEFRQGGKDHDAWFTSAGEWVMTEVDHGRNIQDLPQAVQSGYDATAYALQDWRIDDIDEIQRPAYETIYIIEVEKGGQSDCDLYFDLNGTLFREVQGGGGGSHDGMIGTGLPAEIQQFVDTKYPGATVVDFDSERGGYELDIRHDGLSKDILFDSSYNWIQTSTDLSRNVPADIRSAVEAAYPGRRIDDCDYVETAQGETYYLVDLDNYDMDLKITPDGQITETPDY